MNYKKVLLALMLTSLFSGSCARIMVNTVDGDHSTTALWLVGGNSVVVHLPTVDTLLAAEINKAFMNEGKFAGMIQDALINKFRNQGIYAVAGEDHTGNYLETHIRLYKRGSGLMRVAPIPYLSDKYGRSELSGTVTLHANDEVRVVDFSKNLQVYSRLEIGDQARKDIGWMATAVIRELTQ